MSYEKQFWEHEPTNDDMEEERKQRKEKRHASYPKADPKEKELYSIKPLVWRESFDDEIAETPFGTYCISSRGHVNRYWKCYFSDSDADAVIDENCTSPQEAMQKCTDHFNSKLKLCLNREL